MPSQRKRIGFLPSEEVQNIIDQICKQNKLSQSKVTGILVEEALNSRGVLNSTLYNKSTEKYCNNNKSLLTNIEGIINYVDNKNDNINLDKSNKIDEVKMINDYIEFKFFKNIMSQKKNI